VRGKELSSGGKHLSHGTPNQPREESPAKKGPTSNSPLQSRGTGNLGSNHEEGGSPAAKKGPTDLNDYQGNRE